MATIRPTIYVGLGGTGIKAISRTKKMFEDAFGKGNIPQQIAFAAIDFDLAVDPNLPTEMREDFLTINNAGSPRQLYEVRHKQGEYQWMFPVNVNYIGDLISDGASQVRTYGRFLTEMIINNIERRIADCYTQVTNIQASSDVNVDKTGIVDIHIAMSLAGGTGCGSFINVASMLRDKYQNKVKITGYGVLHSVFRTMDPSTNKTPRVVSNAYSAILDLDYLMEATAEKPITLTLNGKKTELRQPLYDEFFVVDNETENGKRVDNVVKLCEVIGTCMYVSGSEIGSKIQSGQSNTRWQNGNFNISPKLGWAQGLGACQVVYKGDLLADIYGMKAAVELIRKMQSTTSDIHQKAQTWSEMMRIREDGAEYNLLTDAIYAPEKIAGVKVVSLDIKDSIANTKSAVAKYLENFTDFPNEKAIDAILKPITKQLKDTVLEMLALESGVGDAKIFLTSLNSLCEKYKGEMETERMEKEKESSLLAEKLETRTFREYQDYLDKVFKTAKGKQERIEVIEREAKNIKKLKLEAKRRAVAYDIYTQILMTVETLLSRVDAIDDTLTSLKNSYTAELNKKQNSSESSLVFEYDLSTNERLNMSLNPDDVVVSAFTGKLKSSIYEVDLAYELDKSIRSYVGELDQAKRYKETLIVDIIRDLSEEDYKNLKHEITEKSSRLLKLNDRGQVSKTRGNQLPTSMLVQNYLISIYNGTDAKGAATKSRLEADREFMRDINKEFVSSDFDSMKQKIIFYRADMAIIPYCIDSFDDLTIDNEYGVLIRDAMQSGSTGFNPHFDKEIFEDMRKRDFKLKPEMQNEAMFYWVCGNLFGWKEITEDMHIMEKDRDGAPLRCTGKEEVTHPKYIRIKAGKYMYWDEEGDPGRDQKWKPMENTNSRDQAYTYFKTIIFPEIKQVLAKKISDDIKSRGEGFYVMMAQNLVDDGIHDYINKVVCSNRNSNTISSDGNTSDWNQYLEEWKFIEKDLINSLTNLKA
ncbi:MAG: hypothetical protein E7130_02005 [Rikenellaceae bacterium]|nr:hypothetical protein [Rikenellaceae bacterium]